MFHHTGFVVNDIIRFEKKMIFEQKVKEVFDPVQQARLSLYTNFSNGFIELIQPLQENAYTWEALKRRGNHFHHMCYAVENTARLAKIVHTYKLIEVLKPVPAFLFDNKPVCFYYTRNKELVEFLIDSEFA
jgi:hypothetical protein